MWCLSKLLYFHQLFRIILTRWVFLKENSVLNTLLILFEKMSLPRNLKSFKRGLTKKGFPCSDLWAEPIKTNLFEPKFFLHAPIDQFSHINFTLKLIPVFNEFIKNRTINTFEILSIPLIKAGVFFRHIESLGYSPTLTNEFLLQKKILPII